MGKIRSYPLPTYGTVDCEFPRVWDDIKVETKDSLPHVTVHHMENVDDFVKITFLILVENEKPPGDFFYVDTLKFEEGNATLRVFGKYS